MRKMTRVTPTLGSGWSDSPRGVRRLAVTLVMVGAVVALTGGSAETQGQGNWFSAWTVSHGIRITDSPTTGTTVRQFVRPTIAGHAIRVKLENTLGQGPVIFAAAYIGRDGNGAAVQPGTNIQLTFDGKPGLTLAPGAGAWSDPAAFEVKAFDRLALSLDVTSAADVSAHALGLTTNYVALGAHAADIGDEGFMPVPAMAGNFPFYWIAAVDVRSRATTGTVVAFGDSITDGRCSTRDANLVIHPDLYQRWVDLLAERAAKDLPASQAKAFAIEAIAGNRIVSGGNGPPALERLDRDVLERAGVTHVIFFEGTNDIAGGATAEQVIAGAQQVLDRLHAKGIKVIGVTIVPRGRAGAGWDAKQEEQRIKVNEWMDRAKFDGLIDWAAMLKGPDFAPETKAEMIKAEWNCDNTHPNSAGYKTMANSIDLDLLRSLR